MQWEQKIEEEDRKSPKMVVLLSVKYQNCSGRFLFAHGVLVHQLKKKTKRELLCKLSLFISRGEIHFNPSPIWPLLGLYFLLYLWDIVLVLRYGYYDNFMDTQTVCAKCTREMERKSQKARHFKCAAFYILLRKSPKCGASWLIGSCGFSSALLLLLGNHPANIAIIGRKSTHSMNIRLTPGTSPILLLPLAILSDFAKKLHFRIKQPFLIICICIASPHLLR